MPTLIWTLIGFVSGSVPYSPLLGRLFLRRDIRQFGDGNPGSTNVFRAGGKWVGVVAVLLDGFKGAIPVGVVYWLLEFRGWRLIPLALAPVLGHAWSPFLRGRGGKAVATTAGIWTGVTGPEAPIVLGVLLGVWFFALNLSGWAMIATWLCFGLHLLNYRPDPVLHTLWLINLIILLWKYRDDLRQRPALRIDLISKCLRPFFSPSGERESLR
ncbi:MAG: glycerol-3-phosphate acyltransferase [Anaerolineales bacterium]